MTVRPLNELRPEEKGIVIRVEGRGPTHRRILDMGVVAGSEVEVERVAPLGDPIAIKVKGYQLALRKEEAAKVQVDVTIEAGAPVPLTLAASGKLLRVVDVRAGWGLRRRLAGKGLTPGAQIRLVNSHRPGPITVESQRGKVTLGHGQALKIMVREEEWTETSSSP